MVSEIESSNTSNYFPLYDGNGNVTEYINSSEEVVAHYEYDPFGNTTVASEDKADDFAYRFSTKPIDATTGLYYYGYRYFDPITGRWPSRDPIGEKGGMNLYGFVGNDGINRQDYLGHKMIEQDVYIRNMNGDGPYHELIEFWGDSADANPLGGGLAGLWYSNFSITSPATHGSKNRENGVWSSERYRQLVIDDCCYDLEKFKRNLIAGIKNAAGKNTVFGSRYWLGIHDCRHFGPAMVADALKKSYVDNVKPFCLHGRSRTVVWKYL